MGSGKPRATRAPKAAHGVIAGLLPLLTDISVLEVDPNNARLHDSDNLDAITASLSRYGQRKPIVVNRNTGRIEAGNGTYHAAKALGWSKIAAVFVMDTEEQAMGYALADNRTAELATWDMEELESQFSALFEAGSVDVVEELWGEDPFAQFEVDPDDLKTTKTVTDDLKAPQLLLSFKGEKQIAVVKRAIKMVEGKTNETSVLAILMTFIAKNEG